MAGKTFIAVHVTPRSGRDEVVGLTSGGAQHEVRLRVSAAPDKGKANKAVCKLVAGALGVPKGAVEVASGATSHHKRLAVAAEAAQVEGWVASLPRL